MLITCLDVTRVVCVEQDEFGRRTVGLLLGLGRRAIAHGSLHVVDAVVDGQAASDDQSVGVHQRGRGGRGDLDGLQGTEPKYRKQLSVNTSCELNLFQNIHTIRIDTVCPGSSDP